MKYKKITEEIKANIVRLYEQGNSLTTIERLTGIERHTSSEILKSLDIQIRTPGFYQIGHKPNENQLKILKGPKPHNKNRDPYNKLEISEAIYRNYKLTAKRRSIEFLLTLEEFQSFIFNNCVYCNCLPNRIFRYRKEALYNGVDRIDSTKSYTKDNCVTCCTMCNIMKNDYTKEEFLNQIKKIYEFNNK